MKGVKISEVCTPRKVDFLERENSAIRVEG